jgi:hypothetical protein
MKQTFNFQPASRIFVPFVLFCPSKPFCPVVEPSRGPTQSVLENEPTVTTVYGPSEKTNPNRQLRHLRVHRSEQAHTKKRTQFRQP